MSSSSQNLNKQFYNSPIGALEIQSDGISITSILFLDEDKIELSQLISDEAIGECIRQLDEYFNGSRKKFDIALNPYGTKFQRKVWAKLIEIAYGETISYGAIATSLGEPKLNRAVGLANGSNPIPIIIPCHRVIGSDGNLTGYAGGLERKRWLLNHERNNHTLTKGQLKLF